MNKFWMDTQYNIVAQCKDIKTDFEKGFLFNRGKIQKYDGELLNESEEHFFKAIRHLLPDFEGALGYKGLELRNETNKYLIQFVIKHE